MTGIAIRYDLSGLEAAGRRLEAILERAGDLDAVLDEIGGALVQSVQERFESGTGPDGERWKPSIRALAESGQTLVDSGRLRDSITHAVEPGRVVIGSNLVYAAIHQLGGEAGRNHAVTLPARPYLGISAGDEIEIGAILDDHLAGAVQ